MVINFPHSLVSKLFVSHRGETCGILVPKKCWLSVPSWSFQAILFKYVAKVASFITRLRWKMYFILKPSTKGSKQTFGFKSTFNILVIYIYISQVRSWAGTATTRKSESESACKWVCGVEGWSEGRAWSTHDGRVEMTTLSLSTARQVLEHR